MSYIRQSESENDNGSSSLSSSLSSNSSSSSSKPKSAQEIEDRWMDTRIPLSTSIVLDKLPASQQEQVEKTLEKHEQKHRITADSSHGPAPEEVSKVSIRFQPIGSTAAINPNVFKISSTQTIATLSKFLCKRLKQNYLCLYIQSSFSPAPEEKIGNLYELFKTKDELIISYCNSVAFG
ncbi:ATG12 [Candida margitis]|uniref:ATG12 n=1 Tax=Candida margitis TaxID=1775924 RepID=UPI002226D1A4|nr:ATG12 [Candida margitis]KAI5969613.1 ATG12 [Candida margitis]